MQNKQNTEVFININNIYTKKITVTEKILLLSISFGDLLN